MSDKRKQEPDDFSWYTVRPPLESYLPHQGRKFLERFDVNAYLYLIAARTNFHLVKETGFESGRKLFERCRHQEYLVFSIDSDVCFDPEEQEIIHRLLTGAGVKSTYRTVHSEKEHDSDLLEPELHADSRPNMLQ